MAPFSQNLGAFLFKHLVTLSAADWSMKLQIKMLMDIKKIYHRDAERDEGWYEFDVTPAVQRWIARNPKNFQVFGRARYVLHAHENDVTAITAKNC